MTLPSNRSYENDRLVEEVSRHAYIGGPDFDEIGDCCLDDVFAQLIARLGEDVTRESLLKTPQRAERSLRFVTNGYQADVESVLNGALFEAEGELRKWSSKTSSFTAFVNTTCCPFSVKRISPISQTRKS